MLWLAGELLAKFGVLCCHAHGAGVQVALAHHDATFNHQRCGGKAKFISAQHGTDHHVAAGFHLAINLYANATTQAVQHQCLLCFSQAQFPIGTGVLDG